MLNRRKCLFFLHILELLHFGICLKYPNVTTKIENLDYSKAPPNDEQRLLRHILRAYDKSVRPVYNASSIVRVAVGLTLTHIFNVDEKKQVLSMNVWLEQAWRDERLQWEPSKFGNITTLTVPTKFLWTPDIVLYNNAEDFSHGIIQTNVNVYTDGSILWAPPIKSHSTCKLDVSFFPFDEQICSLRFGSWIYDARQVDVTNRNTTINIDRNSSYIENGEWEVVATVVERNLHKYPCCPLPYPDVTFTLHLRRRTLYYSYNIIIPCTMLSILTIMQFCLPTESGEKVTLGLTMLLAYSVFSFNIAEKLPETSDVIPLIAIYIMCVMAISSISVTFSVMVLNIRHGGECSRGVPNWLRFLAFRILAPLVCYRTNESRLRRWFAKQTDFQKAFLQISDRIKMSQPDIGTGGLPGDTRHYRGSPEFVSARSVRFVENNVDNRGYIERSKSLKPTSPIQNVKKVSESGSRHPCTADSESFTQLLLRVNHLTTRLENDFKNEETLAEWRKVSQIFDLFFFGLIVFITLSVTVGMLVLAPMFSSLDINNRRRVI